MKFLMPSESILADHFATSVGQSNIASVLREIEHKAQCMFPPVPTTPQPMQRAATKVL